MVNNSTAIIQSSGSKTASFQTLSIPLQSADEVVFYINVTAASGTPSLSCQVETSPDGTNWYSVGAAGLFPAITAISKNRLALTGMSDNMARLNCTMTGGTPNLTLDITATAAG